MIKTVEVTGENRAEIFKDLYQDWAATIIGLTPSDKDLFVSFVDKQGEGFEDGAEVVHFTGKDMNEFFKLKNDPYPDDLNNYAIRCGHIKNVNALAIPMRQIGMRWFTDIVDNNARHEGNSGYVSNLVK